MSGIRDAMVCQFGNPKGLLGRIASLIMQVRPSNRKRNLRTVDVADIRPEDNVLEIGFGPGLAVAEAARRAFAGKVCGIDRSELMLEQARRRNRKAVDAGRVDLRLGAVERLPKFGVRFDKIFAVNVFMFWEDPGGALRGLRSQMSAGGTIALTLQPRSRGATNEDSRAAASSMEAA